VPYRVLYAVLEYRALHTVGLYLNIGLLELNAQISAAMWIYGFTIHTANELAHLVGLDMTGLKTGVLT